MNKIKTTDLRVFNKATSPFEVLWTKCHRTKYPAGKVSQEQMQRRKCRVRNFTRRIVGTRNRATPIVLCIKLIQGSMGTIMPPKQIQVFLSLQYLFTLEINHLHEQAWTVYENSAFYLVFPIGSQNFLFVTLTMLNGRCYNL